MDKNSLYENSRSFDAYYYSFSPIGEYRFDVILHAVAKAGKAYHSTEDWGNESTPWTEHLSGESPIDWICNAVASANGEFQEVKSQRDQLLAALKTAKMALNVGLPEYSVDDALDIINEVIAAVEGANQS